MKKAASPKNDEAAKICPLGTIQFCTGIILCTNTTLNILLDTNSIILTLITDTH